MRPENEKMRKDIKKTLEDSAQGAGGTIERLERRIDTLETALAHTMAWMADHMRLTDDETVMEDGLTDW